VIDDLFSCMDRDGDQLLSMADLVQYYRIAALVANVPDDCAQPPPSASPEQRARVAVAIDRLQLPPLSAADTAALDAAARKEFLSAVAAARPTSYAGFLTRSEFLMVQWHATMPRPEDLHADELSAMIAPIRTFVTDFHAKIPAVRAKRPEALRLPALRMPSPLESAASDRVRRASDEAAAAADVPAAAEQPQMIASKL
jgi:hypothetical protein